MSYRAKMALRRLAITALTVIGLWGCFTAYAQITRPLLKPVAVSLPNRPPEEPPRPGPSGELVARSERYLRRHGWLWTPRYRIRSDNAVVFAQERVSADDNDEVDDTGAVDGYRRIRFRPFAMVVFPDGRTSEPFVVTSDSAQLEFEEELSLSDVDGGRIQGATLSGAVRISGADGLRIAGRDFVYQDNGSRIWSESETSFEYDGHRGVGQGVEVTLGSAPNTGDRRLLSSTEVQRVQLRRDVRMVLRIDDEPGNDPDPVDIRSRDGVLFDLNTRIATFERDVEVFRRTGPHQADSLEHCDELMIVLAPRDAESAPHGARASGSAQGTRATIRQIMARGNRLKLRSDDNELEADARSVTYDVEEHSIQLGGGNNTVRAVMEGSEITGSSIVLVHDEHSEIQSAECRGPGEFIYRQPGERTAALVASWSREATMRQLNDQPVRLVQLTGAVRLRQAEQNFALAAKSVRVWMDDQTTITPESGTETLVLRNLVAEGDVQLRSPQLRVRGPTERFILDFDRGFVPSVTGREQLSRDNLVLAEARHAPAGNSNPIRQLVTRERDAVPGRRQRRVQRGESGSGSPGIETLDASARLIRARIRLDGRPSQGEISAVWMQGDVTVLQPGSGKSDPISVTGEFLHVRNQANGRHFRLSASPEPGHVPAAIVRRNQLLEGRHIEMDTARSSGIVDSPGRMRLLVARDLEGNALQEPAPLEVRWQQHMLMDGRVIRFIGGVDAVIDSKTGEGTSQRQEIRCHEMIVTLARKFRFGTDLTGSGTREEGRETTEIESVVCQHNVHIINEELAGGNPVRYQQINLGTLRVDQQTGRIDGDGPGTVLAWHVGTPNGPSLSNVNRMRANRPSVAESIDWRFTRVDFLGFMDGELYRDYITLHDQVEMIHSPVRAFEDVINPDDASGRLPRGAAWMRCDELRIELPERTKKANRDWSIVGIGNTQLEGDKYDAQADQISYENAKDQFILRGDGDRKAYVWFQERPAADREKFNGQYIRFIPSRKLVQASGTDAVRVNR